MCQIACKDVGCCDKTITADDEVALKEKILEHDEKDHPEKAWAMTPDRAEELAETVRRFARTI